MAPVLGARFEVEAKVLAFTADTTRSENVVPLARGADLLVHDSRYGATLLPDCSFETLESRRSWCPVEPEVRNRA